LRRCRGREDADRAFPADSAEEVWLAARAASSLDIGA
jgi:hypothetical protein